MRSPLWCLLAIALCGQAVAENRVTTSFVELSSLAQCNASGDAYKHTDLGYPISRIDWGFMSIDTADFVFDDTPCYSQAAATLRYIAETFPQLGRELALGFGPYTQNMLTLLGCPASEQRPLVERLRGEFRAHWQTTDNIPDTVEMQARQYFSLLLLVTQLTDGVGTACTGLARLTASASGTPH